MSTGQEQELRRVWLALLCFTLLFISVQVVKSAQARIEVAEAQTTHKDIGDKLEHLEQWQAVQDRDTAVHAEQLKEMSARMEKLEQYESQSEIEHKAEMERLVKMETIITENQFMVRGAVVGIVVLIVAEILKLAGISLKRKEAEAASGDSV